MALPRNGRLRIVCTPPNNCAYEVCTMLNLRSVDLNLLPVFEAAYEERNLSRAAERLAMTQSAVSHAVTRLRAVFRDELFIPQARGMLPTPAADMVYTKLRGALTAVRESVTEMRGFDPKTSERRFFISIPHPLGPMIAVRLRERLAHAAPGIKVTFSTRSRPVELERGMREGRVDAAVDWLVPAGPKFKRSDAIRGCGRGGGSAWTSGVAAAGVHENPQGRSIRDLAAAGRRRESGGGNSGVVAAQPELHARSVGDP